VKTIFHSILASLLILLFCQGIIQKNDFQPALHQLHASTTHSQEKQKLVQFSSDTYCSFIQHEMPVSAFFRTSVLGLKNGLNQFRIFSIVQKQLLAHSFVQYRFYSKHIIRRLQIADIIFPFHVFL
jgi:hypothetical protein